MSVLILIVVYQRDYSAMLLYRVLFFTNTSSFNIPALSAFLFMNSERHQVGLGNVLDSIMTIVKTTVLSFYPLVEKTMDKRIIK